MPENAGILCRRDGTTLTVTLNRPEKLNALNAEMVEALLSTVQQACDDGTRLLVLRGAGRNFSAGFDLGGFEQVAEAELVLRLIRIEQLLQAVYYAPYETVALAHGRNFGAGVDLICACSRRIAAPGSTFRMPGLQFGLVLGTRRLAQRVGIDVARSILLRSHTFSEAEALSIGFLTGVAPEEEWGELVEQAARAASALSREAAADLFRVVMPDSRATDLAELVTSAARPGLKERIRRYRAQA
jgi:enoyl-CoA hydratase/carnithine racemase